MPKKTAAREEAQPAGRAMDVGAVVRLKSGGPKMTIKSQEGPGADFWCQWFAGEMLQVACFGANTLVLVAEEKKKKGKIQ